MLMPALSMDTTPAGIIFPVDRKRLYMTPVRRSATARDTAVAGLQSLPCKGVAKMKMGLWKGLGMPQANDRDCKH